MLLIITYMLTKTTMMILKTDKTKVVIMLYYSGVKGKLVSLPHLNIFRKDLKIKKVNIHVGIGT